nr:uncharacterized protein LOC113742015 [Coffea arabica]
MHFLCIFFVHVKWFSTWLRCSSKGSKTGRSLVPYLFLICSEAFSYLPRDSFRCGKLKGIAVAEQAPSISHLLFANDTLLFGKDAREEAENFLGIIELYERFSAQWLPSVVGRSKSNTEVFASIKDRVWQRIQGWHEQQLSRTGKAILLKAVIQAIPTYAMLCFQLLHSILCDIESMFPNYWWGDGS